MAVQWHPDKHKGDSVEAEERFKDISEAYQVLSDPELRGRYDKYGEAGARPEQGFVNPTEVFGMIFGGPKFEPFFGELPLYKLLADPQTPEEEQEIAMEVQPQRIQELADLLIARIQPFVDGRREEFIEQTRATVEDLKVESNGLDLLHDIGIVYYLKGKAVSRGPRGLIAGLSSKKHLAGTLWNVIKSGTNAQALQGRVETTDDTIERAEYEQLLAGMMMDHIFLMGLLDIEFTTRSVCDKVLYAPNNRQLKKARGEALKIMGKMFREAK